METLLALPLFFALMMVVQHFNRKAQATLSSEEKARLLDFNADFYKWHIVPMIILLPAFAGFSYLRPGVGNLTTALVVYLVLIAAHTIGSDQRHARKLLTLGLPAGYLATTKKTRLVSTIATLMFFLWIGVSTSSKIGGLGVELKKLQVESLEAP